MSTPNTVALTYNGYVTQIATLAVYQFSTVGGIVTPTDTFFANIIPQMINYAELRIQRDLDFLQSIQVNATYSLTSGSNVLIIDVNDFVTIQTFQYSVPGGVGVAAPVLGMGMSMLGGGVMGAGALPLSGGAAPSPAYPILPTSREFIQNVYNDPNYTGPPQYVAPYGGDAATTGGTSQLYLFGPFPDQAYVLTILGTNRMVSLNSFGTSGTAAGTNTTFISAYLPDLLIMASMVYLSGAQRNFGRESDDPAMAVSYESQYQGLLKGATVEEARRKWQASGWTSQSTPPVATPGR